MVKWYAAHRHHSNGRVLAARSFIIDDDDGKLFVVASFFLLLDLIHCARIVANNTSQHIRNRFGTYSWQFLIYDANTIRKFFYHDPTNI